MDKNTEEKILDAAKVIFTKKGHAAARMQEIADAAGINKALLHYYYRSKDKLFEAVFKVVLKQLVIPNVNKILQDEEDIFKIIGNFVKMYYSLLIKNPFIPLFILEEINKNPDRLYNSIKNSGLPVDILLQKIRKAMEEDKIIQMDPRQIIISIISLCVFPFAAKNIILPILFDKNNDEYRKYLEKQKNDTAEFIIRAIKK